MKKTAILCLALVASATAFSQERVIRMSEAPSKTYNIAEEDGGSFWCAIEAGGGSTAMEYKKNVAMLSTTYTGGYRFNQYLKVGAGLGVIYYPNSNNVRDTKYHLAMPLFLNVRGNILSEEIRYTVPYWSVNVGMAIPDGFFLTPTVGLRIGEKRNAFLVGISYTFRHFKAYSDYTENYSGALLKLGYEF
ncbi:MAG: hypothetical protein IKV23_02275 [Bacteroidaceae bacterium]|nr:hypothetical protein [Bacteroidaceae bacterium]